MNYPDGRFELHRRSPADRAAYLAAQRAQRAAEGWPEWQLAYIDRMIAEAEAAVETRTPAGWSHEEMRDAILRWVGIPVDDGAEERMRAAEIAAGKLRIGGPADWYASVRWSDQAFGVIRTRGPHVLLEPVWNPLR